MDIWWNCRESKEYFIYKVTAGFVDTLNKAIMFCTRHNTKISSVWTLMTLMSEFNLPLLSRPLRNCCFERDLCLLPISSSSRTDGRFIMTYMLCFYRLGHCAKDGPFRRTQTLDKGELPLFQTTC